jgi:hypothetical protein
LPRRVSLNPSLAAALAELFPTLDWNRIGFFVGIRWPFCAGDEAAIALPGGLSAIRIYIRADCYEPATHRFFLLCAHELVHALQIQSSPLRGRGLGLLNAFAFYYLTGFLKTWSAAPQRGNRHEDEAYAYEAVLGRALSTLPRDRRLPCLPSGQPNPAFAGAARLAAIEPRVIKRCAAALGPSRGRALGLGLGRGAGADWCNAAGWCLLGAGVGAIAGGAAGAALAAAAGLAVGLLDRVTGVPSGVVAAAVLVVGAPLEAAANALLGALRGGRQGP